MKTNRQGLERRTEHAGLAKLRLLMHFVQKEGKK